MLYRLDYHPDKNKFHFLMMYSGDVPPENSSGWITVCVNRDGNKLHRFQQYVSSLPTPPPPHEIRKMWREFK
jgi:hypothetical protein